jgi:CubicO group peptidase (beta-lactamase class C family)
VSRLSQAGSWKAPHVGVAVVGTGAGGPEVLDRYGETALVQPIASVTKVLVGYAVMIAVEEEAITLHDPAGPPGATVRHLLAHTAGYGFEATADVLAAPGTRRIYSNRGFDVLADHLELSTGIPMAEYLHEAVTQPLGMEQTRLEGSAAKDAVSTVDDLARFAAELLAPTLIAPQTFAEMVAVQFPGLSGVLPGHGRYDPLDWGLGVTRSFSRPGHWAGTHVSDQAFGHFGGSGSFLWVDPPRALACVCLTGREFGRWALRAWPPLCDAVVDHFGR